ncbi:SRPBCC family protein [Streptomyces lonarensis]|uniref:Polyketide cyclase n=1 Tax=Streptomyces lonarensis TaxID=700599 RepID=A0A7X6I090_9ACTN|nr:SRPBCC family protein [Streptomyces lonarensis]NJQ07453.1 polyketide cyclase [Streptomyces lonarensis]
MSAVHTALHTTFSLERRFAASASRVFAAWSDPAAKARWFGAGAEHSLDFRVGGRELTRGTGAGGEELAFASVYQDLVPDERIVHTSTLTTGEALATVSTTTIELAPDGDGTRLTLTEQATFLDGHEEPEWRQLGTARWLDRLGAEVDAAG